MAKNLVFQEIFDGGSTGGSSTGGGNTGGDTGGTGGNTGGGGGIIEVLQLPTENIDNRYLYRVTKAALYINNEKQGTTYVVDELPEVGEPVSTDGATITATYYNDTDNTLYGYVPDYLGALLGVPEGWYDANMLMGALGIPYGGVVTNLAEASEYNTFYLLLTNPLYSYEDGNWYEVATTGASLTLKSRVFRSWNEAIAFCITHKVYEMKVEGLKITGYVTGTNTVIFKNIQTLNDNSEISLEGYDYWGTSNKYDIRLRTNYSQDGSVSPELELGFEERCWFSTDNGTFSKSLYTITELDGSPVTEVTIYYFE